MAHSRARRGDKFGGGVTARCTFLRGVGDGEMACLSKARPVCDGQKIPFTFCQK